MIKVGQRFYEERLKKGLTLDKVSLATKIRVEFLEALEKGEYQKLPSAAYAQGFARSYARFLDLPEKETLALFRREFSGEKIFKILPEGLVENKSFPLKRIKIGQTLIAVVFIFILLIGFILFQYRGAILGPSLSVSSPSEMTVVSSGAVKVFGATDPNTTVFVNNEAVSVDSNGNFKKELSVFPGKTTITIKAVNSFGKQTVVKRDIVVK